MNKPTLWQRFRLRLLRSEVADSGAEEMSIGDNPAFPETGLSGLPNGEFVYGRSGMTLRQHFASLEKAPEELSIQYAEALTGKPCPKPDGCKAADPIEVIKFWASAEAIYRIMKADALLAELEKQK